MVPRRRPRLEILDRGDLPPEEVEKSLADIRFVNRFWGGARAASSAADRLFWSAERSHGSVLDLGTGTADVLREVARRAGRFGVSVRMIALDRQLAHLLGARRAARAAGPPGHPVLLGGDARRLPLADRSVDWVFSSLFLHHFSPEENADVLREMARVARRGFFVIDLRRHRLARWFVGILGPLFFRSRVSVLDGCASVEQAYTVEEVEEIARIAGLAQFQVRRVPPFRLELSVRLAEPV
jgi:ubiquinone/menaquinone biosynthesis C-methylase UbiE